MSTPTLSVRPAATQPGLSAADRAAHDLSTFVRRPATAADDHGKTKDPLPQRPRGPHPYRTVGGVMATDLDRLTAAQMKADAVIRMIVEVAS